MAAALRRLNLPALQATAPRAPLRLLAARWCARGAGLLLFGLPLLAALPLALHDALQPAAWADLATDPQLPGALRLTLGSAVLATLLSLLATMALTAALHGSAAGHWLAARLSGLLAVPHAAFAIGLAWLVAPSGALARLLAPLAGWDSPPPWATVQDPQALLLTAVLVLKETPFLLWSTAALLARPEVALQLRGHLALAQSLGYAPVSTWWRVLWPLWLPRLAWPLAAVLAYGLTVVDLGLIVGPSSPPTLAVLAWGELSDPAPLRQARGSVLALGLLLLLGLCLLLALAGWRLLQPLWLAVAARGVRAAPRRPLVAVLAARGLVGLYAAVLLVLVLLSVAGVWTFPSWWQQAVSLAAWGQVAQASGTVAFSAGLALAASALALLLVLVWLEATPAAWDRVATPWVLAPLVVPGLLLMSGLYRGALALQLDGQVVGLLWVHVLVVLPYVFIGLQPAWRSFDPRYAQVALSLGQPRWRFWWRVKAPMLAAPLAAALAVGFAVSLAQYLATQFIGAGRHATLTTEAVTLASGGQRTLAAAFALLQALLPLLVFAAAQAVQRRGAR